MTNTTEEPTVGTPQKVVIAPGGNGSGPGFVVSGNGFEDGPGVRDGAGALKSAVRTFVSTIGAGLGIAEIGAGAAAGGGFAGGCSDGEAFVGGAGRSSSTSPIAIERVSMLGTPAGACSPVGQNAMTMPANMAAVCSTSEVIQARLAL